MCQIQLHTAPTLLNAWQKYGFGSLPNGYLKMINPDEYQGPLHDSCVLSSTAVPIFVTAFADIPTWEKAGLSALSSTKTACLRGLPPALISFGAIWLTAFLTRRLKSQTIKRPSKNEDSFNLMSVSDIHRFLDWAETEKWTICEK